MASESYHGETDTLSCSQLKIFIKSPRDYYEQFCTGLMPKRESSRAMVLGVICHAILLEKKPIDTVCRAYPSTCLKSNGSINSGPAREFEEKIFPILAVKDDLIEQVELITASVMKSEFGDVLRSGADFEQRVDAVLDGVSCRCRPDVHSVIGGIAGIWDMKFCDRVYPDDWWRTAKNLGYHVQDSHYSRILEEKHQVQSVFRFVACEVNYPYRVRLYCYDQRSRELSKEFHAMKLAEFAKCRESGVWSDNWDVVGTVSPWELGANDEGDIDDELDWSGMEGGAV